MPDCALAYVIAYRPYARRPSDSRLPLHTHLARKLTVARRRLGGIKRYHAKSEQSVRVCVPAVFAHPGPGLSGKVALAYTIAY